MRPGTRNLITDVAGIRVGNAADPSVRSGTTVILCEPPAVGAVDVRGGAPGTRETDLLAPEMTVAHVDAVVLSGGSAFGLDAASAVAARLAAEGRGFALGAARVPIVPAAILFDLLNGGVKDWGEAPPYHRLGIEALEACGAEFRLGTEGAGYGAATATLKGGLGSASAMLPGGATIGALAAVNAAGSATIGDGPHFWAAPFELDDEFGGLGLPTPFPPVREAPAKAGALTRANTTIAVIATDVTLTKAQARRLAVAAQDGLARALWPAHTPLDGDTVFALATGVRPPPDPPETAALAAAAAATLSRAIARGVFHARPEPGDRVPAWRARFAC